MLTVGGQYGTAAYVSGGSDVLEVDVTQLVEQSWYDHAENQQYAGNGR